MPERDLHSAVSRMPWQKEIQNRNPYERPDSFSGMLKGVGPTINRGLDAAREYASDPTNQGEDYIRDTVGASTGPGAGAADRLWNNPSLAAKQALRNIGFDNDANPFFQRAMQFFGEHKNLPAIYDLMTPAKGEGSASDYRGGYMDFAEDYVAGLAGMATGRGSQEGLLGFSQMGDLLGDVGSGLRDTALGATEFGAGMMLAETPEDQYKNLLGLVYAGGETAFTPGQMGLLVSAVEDVYDGYNDALADGRILMDDTDLYTWFEDQAVEALDWMFG